MDALSTLERHICLGCSMCPTWVRLYLYCSSKPDTHAQRATNCVCIAEDCQKGNATCSLTWNGFFARFWRLLRWLAWPKITGRVPSGASTYEVDYSGIVNLSTIWHSLAWAAILLDCVYHFGVYAIEHCGTSIFGCSNTGSRVFAWMCWSLRAITANDCWLDIARCFWGMRWIINQAMLLLR
jgi:hypothetical protein